MYVWIVGVPMIDSDPVERGAKVAFGIRHQFSRKRPQVRQLVRVLRRNDEAEVVAIIAASLGKVAFIRLV